MTVCRRMVFTGVLTILMGLVGCGGGSDVGNPNFPVVGTVTTRFSDGSKAVGARVVLSQRGAEPGLGSSTDTVSIGGVTTYVTALFFDTTYTDRYGRFVFDEVAPGSYVLVASYNELLALEYVEQRAYQDGEAVLVVTDPATVYLKNYDAPDTSKPYFQAARIAGTGFIDSINESGIIVLKKVPAASLDIIFYRSDHTTSFYSALQVGPGCQAELYGAPDLPVDYWTPHPCGPRDPLGRPYILESAAWNTAGSTADVTFNEKVYDIRLRFSHAMDALSTKAAIHAFSDDSSASVESLRWDGGNTVYIALCVADTGSGCRSGNDRFLKGLTYGVTIDTTAQTALGVHFAHDAYIRFTPIP
jgi:hypothetical protein